VSGSRSELPFFRSEVLKAIVVVGGGVRLEMSEVVRNYSDWWVAREGKKKGKNETGLDSSLECTGHPKTYRIEKVEVREIAS